jgi:hypothetical protein
MIFILEKLTNNILIKIFIYTLAVIHIKSDRYNT